MISSFTSAFIGVRLFRHRWVAATLSWLALVAHVFVVAGCNYYQTKRLEVKPDELTQLANSKVFLIHQGADTWQLNNPRLQGDTLTGRKTDVAPILALHPAPASGTSLRYKARNKAQVLNVVHLYVSNFEEGEDQQVSIPLAAMQRLDVVEANTGKTILSHTVGIVGVTMSVFAVLLVIVALTKSSCPFVYAHNGEQYQFVGEAYGGAIFAPAERDDYMPLPGIQPAGGQFQVKITNELRERQYTNVAELWVAHHANDVRVLLDKNGGVQTITRPQAPIKAISGAGTNYMPQLASVDHNAFLFSEKTPGADPNSLVISFANPTQARTGKLVLHAQNSLWLDYLYGEFTKKFGNAYNEWASTQRDVPSKELSDWASSQGIPLTIYLKTTQGWQLLDYVPTVGPLASRDLVIPFSIPREAATQPLQLKLEAGFMFWELDYAAVDFSPNQPVRLEKCSPQTARDEVGRDQRAALSKPDSDYLQQLHPGTAVTLTYRTAEPTATLPNQRTTTFLHTRGYYEHIRQYEGLPNLPQLYAFRRPGRFIEFSKEKYEQSTQEMNLALVNP